MGTLWNKLRGFIVLCLGLLLIVYFLQSKYVAVGEYASIVHYTPITIFDRMVVIGIGVISSALFSLLSRDRSTTPTKVTISIYMLMVIAIDIFGNDILSMREVDWPHNYRPQPLCHILGKNNHKSNIIGTWKRTDYEECYDSISFLSAYIEFRKENIFANGDTTFYYTYNLSNDTLTIYNPQNEMFEN